MIDEIFGDITGFDWDYANVRKSLIKHDVDAKEAEQVFANRPIIIAWDEKHSSKEERYRALGRTNEDRKLFIVFTMLYSFVLCFILCLHLIFFADLLLFPGRLVTFNTLARLHY